MTEISRFFAAASRGTEESLAEELLDLKLRPIHILRGGVSFGTCLEDAYRACLWSRVASRVLFPVATFEARDAQELYEGVYAVDWPEHIDPDRTIAVDVAGAPSSIGSPRFMALKTKDALVDRVRAAKGARPDVDTERADLRVSVHVSGTRVTVSIDLGGRGLHRRGIGRRFTEVPLKENRAAAMLRLAGWPGRCGVGALFDPFCGSGTILLEAAWMIHDVAPGLNRPRIGAEGWRGHDPAVWARLIAEARDRRHAGRHRIARIAGSDASPEAVQHALANVARAGFENFIRIECREFRHVTPPFPGAGLVVTNPPYGARLGEEGELGPLYEMLGDVLRRRFQGWTAWVLCGNQALAKRIGLRPSSRHVLYNGPIECRFLEIPISTTSVARNGGPGWRKPSAEAGAFARKLLANARDRERWTQEGLTCYRLYDSDLAEYNLAVDWYDGAVRVEEYAPPRRIPSAVAERRIRDALLVVPEVLGVDGSDIVLRVRRRRPHGAQPQRRAEIRRVHQVTEHGLRFEVNLTDYLDTGLFLDDRLLRQRIRRSAQHRHFLNLFAYTCTASAAAAAGGALSTTSVDLSNGYLAWGKRNFALNGLVASYHRFIRADALRWVQRAGGRRYGLILLAPPSFSRSKGMLTDFDVQRDHPALLGQCARLLAPGGEILFTTNLRTFVLDESVAGTLSAREITAEITPPDFNRRPRTRAWSLTERLVKPTRSAGWTPAPVERR